MFEESIFNFVNIALAVGVVWVAYDASKKATGKVKMAIQYILFAGLILGVAELIDMFQIFPDGTLLANLVYEKEIPVLALLLLAVAGLKGGKK